MFSFKIESGDLSGAEQFFESVQGSLAMLTKSEFIDRASTNQKLMLTSTLFQAFKRFKDANLFRSAGSLKEIVRTYSANILNDELHAEEAQFIERLNEQL